MYAHGMHALTMQLHAARSAFRSYTPTIGSGLFRRSVLEVADLEMFSINYDGTILTEAAHEFAGAHSPR